ncbi:uncharacterized protein LOC130696555 isoform X2 [Daphnia carinata]|uniref:uncharacterized protein LOC130696555 isoform X2 n=1 Tax=Daphnia carinata TaxID=120202 RepID=UPI002580D496|nr:uncharacterized protein LOC130696555 isoform X2 [Daphnia carinata]
MRQSFLVLLLGFLVAVSVTSAGLKERIQRIPNPITSFWRGLKAGSSKIEKATNRIVGNIGHTQSPEPRITLEPLEENNPSNKEIVSVTSSSHSSQNSNGQGTTTYSHNSYTSTVDGEVVESSYTSSANGLANQLYNQNKINSFKGTIVVPISSNPDYNKKVTVKSPNFPYGRSTPVTSTWNVKVRTNCRRGLVTMKIDELSRLSDEEECSEGFYRVSPFMKQAKICGRVDTVPPFQWYVEGQEPEDVTISLKHNGLNDGYSEGLGFSLKGECLPNDFDMTRGKALKSYSSWLQQLYRDSATYGFPTVVIPGFSLANVALPETTTEGDSTDSLYIAPPLHHGFEPPIQPISPDQLWKPTLNLNNPTNLPIVSTTYAETTPAAVTSVIQTSTISQQPPLPEDATDYSSNDSMEMLQVPNVPVDEDLGDAISYITTILEKPLKARKPLPKQ